MRRAALVFAFLASFAGCSDSDDEAYAPTPPAEDASIPVDASVGEDAGADSAEAEAGADAEAAAPLSCDGAVICEDFETDPFASRWTRELGSGGTMPWIDGGAPASPGHAIASVVPPSEARAISAIAIRSFVAGASGKTLVHVDVRIDGLIGSKPLLALANATTKVALVIGPSSQAVLRASLEVTVGNTSTQIGDTLFPAPAAGWMPISLALDGTDATATVPGAAPLTAPGASFLPTEVHVGVENAQAPSLTSVAYDDVVVESP